MWYLYVVFMCNGSRLYTRTVDSFDQNELTVKYCGNNKKKSITYIKSNTKTSHCHTSVRDQRRNPVIYKIRGTIKWQLVRK